jgi:hypothetical protein
MSEFVLLLGGLKQGGVMDGVCNMHGKNEKLINFGHKT